MEQTWMHRLLLTYICLACGRPGSWASTQGEFGFVSIANTELLKTSVGEIDATKHGKASNGRTTDEKLARDNGDISRCGTGSQVLQTAKSGKVSSGDPSYFRRPLSEPSHGRGFVGLGLGLSLGLGLGLLQGPLSPLGGGPGGPCPGHSLTRF
eukprot:gene13272-19114_t